MRLCVYAMCGACVCVGGGGGGVNGVCVLGCGGVCWGVGVCVGVGVWVYFGTVGTPTLSPIQMHVCGLKTPLRVTPYLPHLSFV